MITVPRPGQPGYREAVEEYLGTHPRSTVLAASDLVLVELDLPGADLVDKTMLPERAAAAGLPVPPTRTFEDLGELLSSDDLEYPLVVKAAVKSRPDQVVTRIDSPEGLAAAVGLLSGAVVTQPFAAGTMRAVAGVMAGNDLLAAVHQRYVRIWPPECGTASAAVTTEPDLDLEARVQRLLAGHIGVFQVQLVGDQLIDVNPRVYGSLPLAVASGANLPAIACAAAAGRMPESVIRARPGVRYRWLEGDVRRVAHDLRRRTLSPLAGARALSPRRGTAHSIESLRDPGPGLARLADVVARGRTS